MPLPRLTVKVLATLSDINLDISTIRVLYRVEVVLR